MRRHKHASRITGLLIVLALIAALAVVMFFTMRQGRKALAPLKETGPSAPAIAAEEIKLFPFSDEDALKEWDEKIFKGKVIYRVEGEDSISYVRATSDSAASAMYYKIKLDAKQREPVIRWKWRVEAFPKKSGPENLASEDEHDFAARVYVIFFAPFIMNSKVLEYIWAEELPVGTTAVSPVSDKIRLMVLESGPAEDGQWKAEERDILADYRLMFGEAPERDVGAIAFMTNTEHTGTSAKALYDEISVGYKKDAQ